MSSRINPPIKNAIKSLAVIVTLLLTLFFSYYNFGADGLGNLYYTAAIKSMSLSWHNFFFASFDPGGFVSVDKPPVAFWLQVVFVKILGFHTWSIMLPEALAALASVAIIYHLVNKGFGFLAGITAAMVLACTPIFIAASRSNNPDALLVLILILSAWALIIAAEKGSLKYLVLSAVLIGIGFNTKMLVAFLMVPIFVAAYLLSNLRKILKTVIQLAAAIIVLCAVSFSWSEAVDLTPANQRPYVGSSSTNSEVNLAFGYNGFNRLFAKTAAIDVVEEEDNVIASNVPGPFRMYIPLLAGQISWFIPFVFLGAIGALFHILSLKETERRRKYITLGIWFGWALFMLVFFSFYHRLSHRYYLNIVAPGIAAMVGIGFSSLLKLYSRRGLKAFLLPVTVLVTTGLQVMILSNYPEWKLFLWPAFEVCIAAALLLALMLIINKLFRPGIFQPVSLFLVNTCMIMLLAAPAIWSFTTVISHMPGADAYAGPELLGKSKSGSTLPSNTTIIKDLKFNWADITIPAYYQALAKYLVWNQGTAFYIVATPEIALAENIIIKTGKPVIALGGFTGNDRILTLTNFNLVQSGEVKYFWVGPGEISKMNSLIINRVITNSKMIDLHVIDKNVKFSHNPGNLYLLTAQ
jgi:4-amino-4-deoxy-L-arabinose transferase-like glycosyltransferase